MLDLPPGYQRAFERLRVPQRLIEIGQQIILMLKADRNADQPIRNAGDRASPLNAIVSAQQLRSL